MSCDAGTMSDKSVTELVGNFRRPNLGGDGHVWLATRGPGEFVGECQSSNTKLYNNTPMVQGQQRQRCGTQGACCLCLPAYYCSMPARAMTACNTVIRYRLTACCGFLASALEVYMGLWLHGSSAVIQQQTCCSQSFCIGIECKLVSWPKTQRQGLSKVTRA